MAFIIDALHNLPAWTKMNLVEDCNIATMQYSPWRMSENVNISRSRPVYMIVSYP